MFQNSNSDIFSWRIIYVSQTESTNNSANILIPNTRPITNHVVFTDHQTAGVGQYGRKWHSTKGKNLACSLFIDLPNGLKPSLPFLWNMYIALVVQQTVQKTIGKTVSIKWPNDILVNGKKVGGILIQNTFQGNTIRQSIVGIGINVNQETFPQDIPDASSLLLETSNSNSILSLLMDIVSSLDINAFLAYEPSTIDMIMRNYNRNLYKYNQEAIVYDQDGNELRGTCLGVNTKGELRLKLENTELNLKFGIYRMKL
jgi:BirA family transcriptional regulator, biotin operon repressor / biotin---[acetyl-CoA-carboxylase] ligase